ncbi:MAG: M20/M25/M40 family metallo-hydrolase [Isosphaerales bacterium]
MNEHDRRWLSWVAVAWVIAVSWFGIDAQKPPPAQPADAPADQFAAGRAQKQVEAIARAPHPMGSPEADRVRGVLVQKLAELGLVPEIQSPKSSDSPARNVLTRLKGQGPPGKKALLLCAHYDSVPVGPGASDDASGVVVVLETLRALKASPLLDRDVIVLFDDGEENGFHGSRLFVDEHPWAKETGVVLNFDARGNSGPSIMFETSEGNGWLVRQYARAAPHPLATSLSMDIYRILPNDTDLTIFKRAGMGGLNFTFSAGLAFYHSPEDTPENLDPRTLQHQGENALATARQLGRLDLDNTKRNDVIYTSILSRVVVSYAMERVLPLALAAAVLFLLVAIISVRTGRMRLVDLVAGAGIFFVAMWASLATVWILWYVLRGLFDGADFPWQKFDVPILTGFAALTTAVTLLVERWSGSRRSPEALCLGAFFWWVILSLATALWLPGASYLFVWPALSGLLGLGISVRLRPGSAPAWVATVLCSIPSLVLLPPLIRALFDGLSLGMMAPIIVLVVLFLGTMLPLLGPLVAPGPKH